jgi:hypothetical protein
VVERVTEPFASPLLLREPTFADDDAKKIRRSRSASNPVVFYDVYIPQGMLVRDLRIELRWVKEQLEIANSSTTNPTVYLTTMGKTFDPASFCTGNCQHLAHYKQHLRGQTLKHMYEFCQDNPAHRVVYLQNQLNITADSGKRSDTHRHDTWAATSSLCLDGINDPNKCNLCGQSFYTMPAMMMNGAWAAHCSYITKLLPPEKFQEQLNEFIAATLIKKIYTRFRFGIQPPQLARLGYGGYGMDHWVGSHPALLPCDLDDHFKSLSYGAHRPGAPSDYEAEKEKLVKATDRSRFREFYYLAGYLLKWQMLYNEVPRKTSWVWNWFDDSEEWRAAVEKHGLEYAVDNVTKKYELSDMEVLKLGPDE